MVIRWKAYFDSNGELAIFDSQQTPWEVLPRDGCLGVVLFEDGLKPDGNHLKNVLVSLDYYFKAGEIYGGDVEVRERNIQAEINARYDNPIITRGIWTTDDLMKQAMDEMTEVQLCP